MTAAADLAAPAEASPVVIRDVFPAEVWLADGNVYRSARAVVTRTRVYVWQAEGRTPVLRLVAAYDPERSTVPRYNAGPREQTILVADEPIGSVVIRRQRGCGCGSPLRGWRPWQPFAVAAA